MPILDLELPDGSAFSVEFQNEPTDADIRLAIKDYQSQQGLEAVGQAVNLGDVARTATNVGLQAPSMPDEQALTPEKLSDYQSQFTPPGRPFGFEIPQSEDVTFTQATGGGLPGVMGGIARSILKPVGEAATVPIELLTGRRVSQTEPLIPELEPAPEAKGIVPSIRRFAAGLTTPENLGAIAAAPLAPSAVLATFMAQVPAGVQQSLQALAEAKTPQEQEGATADLALQLAMGELMRRGINPKPARALAKELAGSLSKEIKQFKPSPDEINQMVLERVQPIIEKEIPNASAITSSEGLSEPALRAPMGESSRIRQSGPPPEPRPPADVGGAEPTAETQAQAPKVLRIQIGTDDQGNPIYAGGEEFSIKVPDTAKPTVPIEEAKAPEGIAAATGFTFDNETPAAWHFTDMRPESETSGLSIAVLKGATPAEAKAVIDAKVKGGYTKPVIPKGEPASADKFLNLPKSVVPEGNLPKSPANAAEDYVKPPGEVAVTGEELQQPKPAPVEPVKPVNPTKLKPGYVRLWRGEREGQKGVWFSDSKETAEFHFENNKLDGPVTLSYVDVPASEQFTYEEAAHAHPDVLSKKTIAESGDHVLPPELAAQARVVKVGKPEPPTPPTPPAVAAGKVQEPTPEQIEQLRKISSVRAGWKGKAAGATTGKIYPDIEDTGISKKDFNKLVKAGWAESRGFGADVTFAGRMFFDKEFADSIRTIGRPAAAPSPAVKPVEGESQQGAIATPGPALAPAPAAVPSLPPKSQRQIITDLAKGLKLPIRFGRLRTTKFAGYFLKVANLIGSKKANDIPIVSHEVGHKLDARFNFTREPALRAELDNLGDPALPGSRSSWTPSKTISYKLGEGVAEFVRHWLTDPAEARRLAPNMDAHFNRVLDANKDFGDVMRQAQSDIQTWRNAEPQARLRSHISIGENPNKTRYTAGDLTRDLVDDLHYVRLAVDDAQKLSRTDLPPSQNPYLLARNLRGSYGMADTFIRNGVVDFKTKAVQLGTSLEDALKPVAGRINDFRDWIVAKQAQELHRQGKETGLVPSDVDFTANKFNGDQAFQEAFTKIKAWNDAVLQYAVDAGLVTPEGAAAMRKMNQDYVPFHRVFEVGAGESPSVEGGGIGRGLNVGKPGSARGRHGSRRDIVDPLETMVRNSYSIITAAEKSAINNAVADLSRLPGMGKWVEHIATPKESVKVGLEKIRKQLEDSGADLTGVPDDLMLQFFQKSKQAPFGENTIRIVKNGKPEFYRLRRELFDTFHALDLEDSGKIIRLLALPTQLLRAGVTLAPDFALANVIRDTVGAAVISKHGMIPFEASIRGLGALIGNPKLVAEWKASGGENAIESTYFDRSKVQAFLREKITKDMTPAERALVITKSPLTALRLLSGLLSETTTRLGEYQKAYDAYTRSGMPEGDARRLAAFESRDRQDFAKGGAKTKIIRHVAAFWNAGLQANVKLAQTFKERPVSTTLKALSFVTIPKLLEQAVNWNDDDYWDRPQWERDLFYMIPAGKGSDGHTRFIRIPVPFELGIIFATLPGRIMQYGKEKDPEALKSFPGTFLSQSVPNPFPQSAQTLFSDFLSGRQGWDIYRGRPVVPDSIAKQPPEMQFTEQSSLTARRLGKLLGFSPMKIDHIIQSSAGGLGKEVTHQGLDRIISAVTGEERTAAGTVPGGRFVSTPAAVSSRAVEDFYKTLEKVREEKEAQKGGREPKEISAWSNTFEATARKLSEYRKAVRLSEDEASKQQYREAMLELARTTMQQYNEAIRQ